MTNKEALKKNWIFYDQIGDKGGWGYGMNSIESLSMGICTLTEMNKSYEDFISDHPFVNINERSLGKTLTNLIKNRNSILLKGSQGKNWVGKYHDISKVADELYKYYKTLGLNS